MLAEAKSIQDWIVSIRRKLHMCPEVMYEEVRTGEVIREVLDELDIAYKFPIARTGIVATIGSGAEPCVALRADMDALPIHEETQVDFRSRIDGRMHACGHDCHMAMLLGAARLLKGRESELRGTVKLIFQPAEEGGAGGKLMCDEGALANPRVESIFGIHVCPFTPTGTIARRAGTLLAAAGIVEIKIIGKGGHAAFPHTTNDPVVTAAKIMDYAGVGDRPNPDPPPHPRRRRGAVGCVPVVARMSRPPPAPPVLRRRRPHHILPLPRLNSHPDPPTTKARYQ